MAFLLEDLEWSNSANYTVEDDLFTYCWRQQSCEACLSNPGHLPCSWCALSRVCVPNTRWRYPFEIFTALKYPEVCPLNWRERWEVRARPWSCRCSTMTLVSVLVGVVGTLVGVVLIWLSIKLGRWCWRRWKKREPGWWRFWRRVTRPQWIRWPKCKLPGWIRRRDQRSEGGTMQNGYAEGRETTPDERRPLLQPAGVG